MDDLRVGDERGESPMTKYIPKVSKYAPLAEHLSGLNCDQQQLTFVEIERILGCKLPPSARRHSAWWSNTDGSTTHPWATLWINVGWKTSSINLSAGSVIFLRHRQATESEGHRGVSSSQPQLGDRENDQGDKAFTEAHATVQLTPTAADIAEPPARQQQTVYRILRDGNLAKRIKALHNNECQICGHTIRLPDGSRYSEAHHIRPLGKPHDGFDTMDNIVCVCPNHHAELDYGARPLSAADLRMAPGHSVNDAYVRYHNEVICGLEPGG
jgi:hypothetical protein